MGRKLLGPHIIQCNILQTSLLYIRGTDFMKGLDVLPGQIRVSKNRNMIGKQHHRQVPKTVGLLLQRQPVLHTLSVLVVTMANTKSHRETA